MIYNSIFPESGLTLELATRKRSELTANGASLFAATGKAFALLWQIFLQVGPSYKKLRLWLSRVTCILTDCGAERKIPDMRDILPEFLDAIGVKYPMGCRMEYLFPNALPAIGWHHVLDGVLQWGLNSLDFFPLLLKQIKAWNKFFRNFISGFSDALVTAGYFATPRLFKKISFVNFPEWRWRKIMFVVNAVSDALHICFADGVCGRQPPRASERGGYE